MKTDTELKKDVVAELDWEPAVDSERIGVSVACAVVTVTGHVASYPQKWAIQKAVRRVAGVRAIALDVDVCIAPLHRRDDTDIAASAAAALQWHAELPTGAIGVTVEKGWMTLQGEVDWDFQRRSAERAVRALKGVVGLCNEITLRKKAAAADITQRIHAALTRRVDREARDVSVEVNDGVVTLRGHVHTWQERDAARGAASAAPGVREVVDELTLA